MNKYILICGAALALILLPIGYVVALTLAPVVAAHASAIGLLLYAFAGMVLIGVLRILYGYGRLVAARARQAEIMPMQNGHLIHVGDVTRLAGPLLSHTLDRHYDVETVRAGISPTLTHYHHEAHGAALPTAPELLRISGPATAQLVGDADWRRWMDRAPHLLIAGRTEAGKTTLATALLIERALAGDQVLVLDPHYQPGKWAGVPTIGGGNNFESILGTLPQLIREMTARYAEFERGRPTEDFQRLTVLIDEAPAIVDATMETTPSGRPRIVDPRWVKFAKRLGSEARKVRISVILMTQSTLVQDILINSQQRENYLRVALGDRARGLLSEEPSSQRRQQLVELLRGQQYPAAMEWKGDFYLLNTSAVPDLAARSAGAVQAWSPPPPLQIASTIPPTTELPPPTNQEQILMALEARPHQTSSALAAHLGIDVQVVRTELGALHARQKVTRREAPKESADRYEWSVA